MFTVPEEKGKGPETSMGFNSEVVTHGEIKDININDSGLDPCL